MSAIPNTNPGEIKPQTLSAESQEKHKQTPDIIVIPDECGDSLWDEVLAQYPDLTTIINKTAVPESGQVPSSSETKNNQITQ
ncbi:hypothetical protein [Chitinophaga pinensis]|uniref:Uncharacterized protein n=1 Tax=Chitinophaga pinensis (strain ATCC 43595 / DSM 2588 / LMG 13176 / NBRC 15968 / NCIMB 11800 / UQM 2034) TaxID=485918 RepID=A0A979FZ31_CHIPD|nr:hypothetical protein [Chitinophaga pinensis]ACU57765.1 hypothetical protein Cpin_0265 [Chitinophaga pinensis DSM 2588]